jgi:hypothetical protein
MTLFLALTVPPVYSYMIDFTILRSLTFPAIFSHLDELSPHSVQGLLNQGVWAQFKYVAHDIMVMPSCCLLIHTNYNPAVTHLDSPRFGRKVEFIRCWYVVVRPFMAASIQNVHPLYTDPVYRGDLCKWRLTSEGCPHRNRMKYSLDLSTSIRSHAVSRIRKGGPARGRDRVHPSGMSGFYQAKGA